MTSQTDQQRAEELAEEIARALQLDPKMKLSRLALAVVLLPLVRDAERYRVLKEDCEWVGSTEKLDPTKWIWTFWTPAPPDDGCLDESIDQARGAT